MLTSTSGIDVYWVLRTINPSPYIYFLDLPDERGGHSVIISSSPETLMRTGRRHVRIYPITGSRSRGANFIEDHRLAVELLEDPKKLSEHAMFMDLARNDLSRVCNPTSVEVFTLMKLKCFFHVRHVSSMVTGVLRADADAFDALVTTPPVGTLSGASKPCAIQLINDFKSVMCGVHGGVVGYSDLSGDVDLATAIRAASLKDSVASAQAGADLAADSVPALEYVGSCNKAATAVESIVRASILIPLS